MARNKDQLSLFGLGARRPEPGPEPAPVPAPAPPPPVSREASGTGPAAEAVEVEAPVLKPVEVEGPALKPVEVEGPALKPVEVQGPALEAVEVEGPALEVVEVEASPAEPESPLSAVLLEPPPAPPAAAPPAVQLPSGHSSASEPAAAPRPDPDVLPGQLPLAAPQLADAVAEAPVAQLGIPMPAPPRRPSSAPVSRRLSDLVRRLQLLERDAIAPLKLTLPQAHAIYALDEARSLRMQELASTLGLAQSTVTRLVAPLKRMGLLDRRPDSDDGRATRAYLTDAGQESVDQLDASVRGLYGGLIDRLPPSRRAEVVAAVDLLHQAVLDLSEEG